MSFFPKRTFLNPLLVLTGIPTLVTGLFLFFHVKSSLIVHTHEIGGLVFAATCLFHLVLNWKALLHSMKGRLPGWGMAALLVVTTGVMAYSGITDEAPRKGRQDGIRRSGAAYLTGPFEKGSAPSSVFGRSGRGFDQGAFGGVVRCQDSPD